MATTLPPPYEERPPPTAPSFPIHPYPSGGPAPYPPPQNMAAPGYPLPPNQAPAGYQAGPPYPGQDYTMVHMQGQPMATGPPPGHMMNAPMAQDPPDGQQMPMTAMGTRRSSSSSSSSGHVRDNQNNERTTLFTEKSIRLGFIKKVFALLFSQLIITAGLMCIFIFVPPVKEYLQKNDWVYITSICLSIALMLIFGFVTKLRRLYPANLVILFIITLVMSTMLGSVASSMDVDEVLIAVGIVSAVTLVCCLLGFQKKFDFTPMVGFVAMFGMILASFGFLMIFFYNQVMMIVYASLGALLFALWLLLDIQLILSGRHKIGLNPEEYVAGALNLYVDIVYMLLMIFFIFKAT